LLLLFVTFLAVLSTGSASTELIDCDLFDESTSKATCLKMGWTLTEVARISGLKHFDFLFPRLEDEAYPMIKKLARKFVDTCLDPHLVWCGNDLFTQAPSQPKIRSDREPWMFAENQWIGYSPLKSGGMPGQEPFGGTGFPGIGYCIVSDVDENYIRQRFSDIWSLSNQTFRAKVQAYNGQNINAYRRPSGVLAEIDRSVMVRNDFGFSAELIELEATLEAVRQTDQGPAGQIEARLIGKTRAHRFLKDIDNLKAIMGALEPPLRTEETTEPLQVLMYRLIIESEAQRLRLLSESNPSLYNAVRTVIHKTK